MQGIIDLKQAIKELKLHDKNEFMLNNMIDQIKDRLNDAENLLDYIDHESGNYGITPVKEYFKRWNNGNN